MKKSAIMNYHSEKRKWNNKKKGKHKRMKNKKNKASVKKIKKI